jgi:hypothetical protein
MTIEEIEANAQAGEMALHKSEMLQVVQALEPAHRKLLEICQAELRVIVKRFGDIGALAVAQLAVDIADEMERREQEQERAPA